MNYQTALHSLLSLGDFERNQQRDHTLPRYNLSRMEEFLSRLGNPQLDIPTVHIAGTKGKGSTAAMVTSILQEQGYKAGLFTSPHLHTFRERIRTGLEPITEAKFASLVERVWPVVQDMNKTDPNDKVTTFEMLVAMAFTHFSLEDAQIQVLEVGLGGRLDATNTVPNPLVCTITPVSLDHTAILGTTIQEIAQEKAGIIKPGAMVVTANQRTEALNVIRDTCDRRGASLIEVGQMYAWERNRTDLDKQSFWLRTTDDEWELSTNLLGRHQIENAALAVATTRALHSSEIIISRESIVTGIEKAQWSGRLEVLSKQPVILADGAHNQASMARLRMAIQEDVVHERLILVLGGSADKDYQAIFEELALLKPNLIIATRSRHPKALPTNVIAKPFHESGFVVEEAGTTLDAMRLALASAGNKDLVLATGSLFVVAEFIEEIKGIPKEIYPVQPRKS